jgi:hypothetical protein
MKVKANGVPNERIDTLVQDIRVQIDKALPPGAVVPQHTADGHFYGAPSGNVYPSVTGKLSAVKDESIQNWNMNEALRFVEQNLKRVIQNGEVHIPSAIDLFAEAQRVPKGLLHAAGDIGTQVHDRREKYFQAWIDSGKVTGWRPNVREFITDADDPRIICGMIALDKFLTDTGYIPIRTEVMVYSDKYKVAGMLDDIGLMLHNGYWKLTLMDVKTSNQMKAHYWLQVALYHMMFKDLVGLKPEVNMILKLNKDVPVYNVEFIQSIGRVVAGAKNVLKVSDTMDFIKSKRKNNGKTVVKI